MFFPKKFKTTAETLKKIIYFIFIFFERLLIAPNPYLV